MNNGTQDGFGKPSAVRTIGTKLAILGRWLGIGTSDADAPLHIQVGADSAGNNPTNPQYGAILEWFEGRRNLGIGEGTKVSWRVKLIGDKRGVEVANIASHKTNSTDTSRLSSLKVNVSTDGIAAPTQVIDITSTAVTVGASVISTSASGGIGYGTGAGASVTQLTSKSTGVTLHNTSGSITMNGAALGPGASVAFIFTNDNLTANDLLVVNIGAGATSNSYTAQVEQMLNGSCRISLRNYSGSGLGEPVLLNFAILKGVTF